MRTASLKKSEPDTMDKKRVSLDPDSIEFFVLLAILKFGFKVIDISLVEGEDGDVWHFSLKRLSTSDNETRCPNTPQM
jgi:hypothetical protein